MSRRSDYVAHVEWARRVVGEKLLAASELTANALAVIEDEEALDMLTEINRALWSARLELYLTASAVMVNPDEKLPEVPEVIGREAGEAAE